MRRVLFLMLLASGVIVALLVLGARGVGPILVTQEGQRNVVLLLQNEPDDATSPGLSLRFGIPILEQLVRFDSRWLNLSSEPKEIPTLDRERIVVDNYVIWRIVDPLTFYRSYRGNDAKAEAQIDETVRGKVRLVIGQHTLVEVLRDKRQEIMDDATRRSNEDLARFGIEIGDVRINRTELPVGAEENVYARMRAERQRLAVGQRAEGDEEARKIRADADREARIIVANALSDAELERGRGDAEAARIYAEAYGQDAEFYEFVRSLEAYRKTIGEGTTMVVPPDHEFFRLFQEGGAMPGSQNGPGAP